MVGSKKETHLILKHDLNSCVKSHFKGLILFSEATDCFHTTYSDTSFRIFILSLSSWYVVYTYHQQCIPWVHIYISKFQLTATGSVFSVFVLRKVFKSTWIKEESSLLRTPLYTLSAYLYLEVLKISNR